MSGTRPGSNTRLSREGAFRPPLPRRRLPAGLRQARHRGDGFLECYADFWEGGGQYIEEIEFVESEQKRDPRIKAIIPMAPVEWGKRVEPMLVKMRDEHLSVRGIRRIMEFDKDPRGLTLSPGFIE